MKGHHIDYNMMTFLLDIIIQIILVLLETSQTLMGNSFV